MFTNSCTPFYLNRFLPQFLIVGTLTTISLLSGVVPSLSRDGSSLQLSFNSSVYAQAVSDDEVTRFAKTGIQLEQIRVQVQQDIKKKTGKLYDVDCYKPQSLQQLPNEIRPIATNFCNSSRSIIEGNGFTSTRFNEIKALYNSDANLRERVRIKVQELTGNGR